MQPARRSTSTASTCRSRAASCSSRRCRSPTRRCISAARRTPAHRARGRAGRHLPDLGRAAGATWREDRRQRAGAPRREGRKLRFGIRLHVIVRETEDEAWARGRPADQPPRRRDRRQGAGRSSRAWTRSASSAWPRCTAAGATELEISPNLWAGVGLVRGGAGTALVGDPETVAARMQEYVALGIDSLHPLRLPAPGGVLPLRRAGVPAAAAEGDAPAASASGPRNAGPFGEIVANEIAAGTAGRGRAS